MEPDRGPKALQSVNAGRICPGCGRPFAPSRRNQRHCRPSCRVLALRRRRETDLLTDVADAIDPAVVERR